MLLGFIQRFPTYVFNLHFTLFFMTNHLVFRSESLVVLLFVVANPICSHVYDGYMRMVIHLDFDDEEVSFND